MNKIRIEYQSKTDVLGITFHGDNLGTFNLMDADHYAYGCKTINADADKIVSVSFTIENLSRKRKKAVKEIYRSNLSPIENLDPFIDMVLNTSTSDERVVLDFYQLRDGSWKEIDQPDDFKDE